MVRWPQLQNKTFGVVIEQITHLFVGYVVSEFMYLSSLENISYFIKIKQKSKILFNELERESREN